VNRYTYTNKRSGETLVVCGENLSSVDVIAEKHMRRDRWIDAPLSSPKSSHVAVVIEFRVKEYA